MEKIHEKSIFLLEKTGIRVPHNKALMLLADAGAKVDFDNSHVYLSAKIVEKCLGQASRNFILGAANSNNKIIIPHPENGFYTRSATGAQGCIDLEQNTYREVNINDVKNWVKVIDALDNLDICAVPTPADAPVKTKDIHALKCALENTQKHIMLQPYSIESIKYLAEMACLVAGGKSEFKKNPLISMVSCATSPLNYELMDVEIMFAAKEYGFPVHIASLVSMGGTAPITIAGSVLQVNTEILAGVVLTQIICPKMPIIAVAQNLPLNMITGIALQSTVEGVLADVAGVQLIKDLYHLPTRTYSLCSDALFGDSAALAERVFMGTLVSLAKTDILSAVGGIEGQNTISLRQLVIDNEILGMLKRMMKGVKIDEDELAVSTISKIGSKGNYLTSEHTLRHCRDIYPSTLFYRNGRVSSQKINKIDILERAKEKVISILNGESGKYLTDQLMSELDEIVTKADKVIL